MTKRKKLIIQQILGAVKTVLYSFILYIVSYTLLAVLFYSDTPVGNRDFTPMYLAMVVIFGIAYYFGYLKKSSEDTPIDNKDAFNWRIDLWEFINSEGVYLFAIYGVLAVLNEVAYLIHFTPITTLLSVCFPISHIISIPFLRTIVAYIITMLVIVTTTLAKHFRDHKYWSKANKL